MIAKTKTLETIFTTMDCGILCHSVDGSKILSINGAALKSSDMSRRRKWLLLDLI